MGVDEHFDNLVMVAATVVAGGGGGDSGGGVGGSGNSAVGGAPNPGPGFTEMRLAAAGMLSETSADGRAEIHTLVFWTLGWESKHGGHGWHNAPAAAAAIDGYHLWGRSLAPTLYDNTLSEPLHYSTESQE